MDRRTLEQHISHTHTYIHFKSLEQRSNLLKLKLKKLGDLSDLTKKQFNGGSDLGFVEGEELWEET